MCAQIFVMCVLVENLLLKHTKTYMHSTYRLSESTRLQVPNWIYSNKRNKRSDQNHLIQTSLSVLKHRKERSGRYRMICFIQAYETNEHTNTTGMCVLVEILLLKYTKTQVHSTISPF